MRNFNLSQDERRKLGNDKHFSASDHHSDRDAENGERRAQDEADAAIEGDYMAALDEPMPAMEDVPEPQFEA